MLIQDKQVSVLVEGAKNEAFVKLADHSKLTEVTLAEHLTQLVVTDLNVISVNTIGFSR